MYVYKILEIKNTLLHKKGAVNIYSCAKKNTTWNKKLNSEKLNLKK